MAVEVADFIFGFIGGLIAGGFVGMAVVGWSVRGHLLKILEHLKKTEG